MKFCLCPVLGCHGGFSKKMLGEGISRTLTASRNFKSHDLRGTATRNMRRAGVPQVSPNEDLRTPERRNNIVDADDVRSARERMEKRKKDAEMMQRGCQWLQSKGNDQHARQITVDEQTEPLSWQSSEPVNERREEMLWISKESAPYAGEWVALDGNRLVAHGPKLAAVGAAARAAGVAEPFFASVPDNDLPFGGW